MAEGVPIRVMVVDSYAIVRNGIKYSLLAFEDIKVVGEASSAEEALLLFPEVRPDVVLMDLMLPDKGGIKATRAMREACPHVQVLVLSCFPEGRLVQEALLAGAIGFLLKDIAVDELAGAIRQASQGKPTLAPAAVQALVHVTTSPGQDLTERERDVLALLVEGLSNDQIAEQLRIIKLFIEHVVAPTILRLRRLIRCMVGAGLAPALEISALAHPTVALTLLVATAAAPAVEPAVFAVAAPALDSTVRVVGGTARSMRAASATVPGASLWIGSTLIAPELQPVAGTRPFEQREEKSL